MFDWFTSIAGRGSAGLERMRRRFSQMLDLGRNAVQMAADAYLGEIDPETVRRRLFDTDQQINEAERQIRREVVVHASVHGAAQLPPSLVLMSIVKDAERVGDYAKNIFDVATIAPRPPEGEHREWFAEVRTGVLQLMTDSRDVFESNDKRRAAELIEEAKKIEDFCDQKVRELIRGPAPADLAPSYVLAYRYFKRVASHVRNVTSSIVLPLHKLDFTHELPEAR